MIRALCIICYALLLSGIADAGQKGKLAGALVDYEDYKTRAMEALQHADELRTQNYSADLKDLLTLFKEIGAADQEIHTLYGEQFRTETRSMTPHDQSRLLLAIHLALKQLNEALTYEMTYQSGQRTHFLLLMRAKAEDMFRTADEEVLTAKSNLSAK